MFFKNSSDFGGPLQKEKNNVSDFKNKWVPTSPKFCKEWSYCHKKGHTMAECRGFKRKPERQEFSFGQPRVLCWWKRFPRHSLSLLQQLMSVFSLSYLTYLYLWLMVSKAENLCKFCMTLGDLSQIFVGSQRVIVFHKWLYKWLMSCIRIHRMIQALLLNIFQMCFQLVLLWHVDKWSQSVKCWADRWVECGASNCGAF